MSAKQLYRELLKSSPHTHIRYVHRHLQVLYKKGIIYRITSGSRREHLYYLTDAGRRFVSSYFDIRLPALPDLDWNLYLDIENHPKLHPLLVWLKMNKEKGPLRISQINESLRKDKNILLLRYDTFSYLLQQGVIRTFGRSRILHARLFQLTEKGEQIADEILKHESES